MPQTILIVDDDADVRTVAQVALTGLGYLTIETGDPQKAILIAKERSVDLLLTDVVMPLMKGTELADRVQEASPSTRILLMSGYQTADIAPSGRAFLAKPFSIDGLAKRVRETLARPSAFARRGASPGPSPHSST